MTKTTNRHSFLPMPLFGSLKLLIRYTGVLGTIISLPSPATGLRPNTCEVVPARLLSAYHLASCPAPLDDQSEYGSWSPWTHRPECRRTSTTPGPKFCVYTNSRHGIGGLSIITTPEKASMGLGVDILDESVPAPESVIPPYEVVEIPGKGKGVIATRGIRKYEQIMVDYASLVIDMELPTKLDKREGYQLLHAATNRLSAPDRVLSLGRSTKMAQDPVEDVLRTNAFHTNLAGEPFMALYPDVSRINHACNPNAFPQFHPSSLLVTVAASKDIAAGEEISISYITLGQTHRQRQEALKRWEFSCSCSLCTAPKEERVTSDSRRMKIDVLREEFRQAFRQRNGRAAIAAANGILSLMHLEELFPMYSEPYENLARVYWAMGDRENAILSAQTSLDILVEQGYLKAHPDHLQLLLSSFG